MNRLLHPEHQRLKLRPKVTAIIGFVNHGTIFLASDSQVSLLDSTAKRKHRKKIFEVSLADGGHVLVATSGVLKTADYFLESFRDEAAKTTPTGTRTVADLAEVTMKKVRDKLMTYFSTGGTWTEPARKQHIMDLECVVMLAYFFQGQPFIYTLGLEEGLAHQQNEPFAAIGCAENVAASVLTKFDLKNMEPEEAEGLAAYTIWACTEFDKACDGPAQIALICAGEEPCFIGSETIAEYEEVCEKTGAEMQQFLAGRMADNYLEMQRRKPDVGETGD